MFTLTGVSQRYIHYYDDHTLMFWVLCIYLYSNAVTERGIKMLAHIYNLYIACGLIVSALCHIMYVCVRVWDAHEYVHGMKLTSIWTR